MKHFKRFFLYALLCAFTVGLASQAMGQAPITNQLAKLLASDGAASDLFGYSVSISADGNTAIVGAYAGDAPASNQGSAYIYIRNTTTNTWTQQAKLVASDAAANDIFGFSVSISADGNTAIVGAHQDDAPASDQGSAYIYNRNTTTNAWTQQAKLVASDAALSDNFGFSVSISADGNTAIVGAYGDDASAQNEGSAYIYIRNTTTNTWAQQAKLVASDAAQFDNLGISASISADGNTAVVGAFRDDITAADQGSAYIYIRNTTTNAWTQQAKLVASDAAASDNFAISVSISANGNTVIVGANGDDAPASDQGSAYIYIRNTTTNTWTQQAKLVASDAAASDNFAISVSINADGNVAVVGAYGDDVAVADQGSAYIYIRNTTTNTWAQQTKLVASDAAASDNFGNSVSISADGNTAVVGANLDDAPASDQGSTYIFTICPTVSLSMPATGQTLAFNETTSLTANTQYYFQSGCSIAASILPNGTSPATGSTNAKAWVEASEPATASSIYTRRHYEITPATNAATATGRVTLYVLQSEFDSYNNVAASKLPYEPTNEGGIERLRIYKYSGTSSDGTGLPGSYTGSPVVINPDDADIVWNSTNNYWEISFIVTGFSGFFIAGVGAFILPVKLSGFTAAKQGGTSVLNWQVAGEENIAAYTIERSADGRSFSSIGSLASLGTTTARTYSHTDASPIKGANYYRLKITEKDGNLSYSEIRLLNFGSIISIALYPNPAKDKTTITGVEAGMSIRLLDAVGKVLQIQKANGTTESIALISLAKGFYSVQVYSANGQLLSTARLVKE